jgi:hypothetical protein
VQAFDLFRFTSVDVRGAVNITGLMGAVQG